MRPLTPRPNVTAPPSTRQPPKWRRVVSRLLRSAATIYLAICLLVFLGQRKLLYQPSRITLEAGTRAAADQSFEPWHNQAGEYIGWKKVGPTNTPHAQLLIIHGNAGSAINRLDYADSLNNFLPLDVYILEYPGYGARSGSPSQKSLLAAADDAFDSLNNRGPIYLMGESLGTGVAAYLAGAHPDRIAGVVLLAPYHNLPDVAAGHFPFLPVHWLLLDRFPAASYLEKYHGPVAVLLAGQDVIVPNQFGHRLYDAYQGPKKLWLDPNAGHNDLPDQSPQFWKELAEFWKNNVRTN